MSRLVFLLLLLVLSPLCAFAEENEDKLPLPRFVSTRSNEINVRTGPGIRYPIKWVMVRESLPLEVIARYEDWCKVRDIEQSEGWVNKAMLSGKRTALVRSDNRNIYDRPDAGSKVVAIANKGTILNLDDCDGNFCEVEAKNVDGFIKSEFLWGIYEGEKLKN